MSSALNATKTTTRDRLLDLAEASILNKGFGATSIDEVIAGAGISKSGFFYHFKDKTSLAKALIERYIARDKAILDDLFRRADELHDDPLHSFLIGLKLFAEMMDALPDVHPGCLVASFCYEDQMFSAEVRELNAHGVLQWRRRFRERLDAIAARHPPRLPVDLGAMADMIATVIEGGIILSRVLRDRRILSQQVMLYRSFVAAAFSRD